MPLTPESIAETWSGGGTVQISTPNDYTVFVTYMNNNTQSSTMRNAEITADLDFTDVNFVFFNVQTTYSNLTLDGNNHTLKNIVKDGISSYVGFFVGGSSNISNVILNDLTFENVYLQATQILYCFRLCTLNNVKLKNARMITARSYYGISACELHGFSSAATVRVGEDYYGAYEIRSDSNKIAILDIVTRNSQGGTANALHTNGTGISLMFSRNRFTNFSTVNGIYSAGNALIPSMSYVAFSEENATTVKPFTGYWGSGWESGSPQNSAVYYDSTLTPSALFTAAGLPSATLKSVAAMQQHGFNVEAV